MRVLLDTRVLGLPGIGRTGVGRYTACLCEGLRLLADGDPSFELRVLERASRPPAPRRFAEAWEHPLLRRDARRAGADIVHAPSLELLSLWPGAPLCVTVHDLVPLKHPERYLRTGLKHRLRYAAARRAARLIVPSAVVGLDAERLLGVPPERITVIAEAAAPAFRPLERPREALHRFDLPERFLLWVGHLDPPDPRKGIAAVAALARERDGLPLVLAGAVSAEAGGLAAPGRVTLTGRVSDEELAALYTAADAVLLPSDDEGFGLPAVEALACGTPVAAYGAGALPELLAGLDATALVVPGDAAGLLDAAEALAGLRATPLARSWDDVARETVAAYRETRT